MRRTQLKRTSIGVVIVLAGVAGIVGILRGLAPHAGDHSGREGAVLFQEKGCSRCHHADSTEMKAGPGLQGLFDRQSLPASGRPATEENVRNQLRNPYKDMPSFADRLTEEQRDELIAYLKTL